MGKEVNLKQKLKWNVFQNCCYDGDGDEEMLM